MSELSTKQYKLDCIKLQEALKGKKPIEFILKTYFKGHSGESKRQLRIAIVNALNGNSLSKAKEYNLMPIFKEVYKTKTGQEF